MKRISALAILMLGFLAPAAHADTVETRAIIEAVFEAFNRHDLDGVVALYHPDAKLVTPGFPEPRYGLEVIRATYKDHFDNIPGVYDEVTRIVAEGDRAAVEFTASWDQPTENDPEAKGTLRISTFITITDGLISADVTYYDRMELTENMDLGDEK